MGGICCKDENDEFSERLLKHGTVEKDCSGRSPNVGQGRISVSPSCTSLNSSRKSGLNPEKELVQSERRYFRILKTLHNEFLVPLCNKRILPKNRQHIFTHDLDMIYNFHRAFLKDLQTTKDIAGLFIAQADFFKIYIHYVENYTLMLDCLAELRENAKFVDFIQILNEKNLHLESLLIAPIQRIPRYELLLKEMIRSSDEEERKHQKLSKALDKVRGVAQKLNERKREFERLARMSYIAARIHGLPEHMTTLYDPHRKFIDEQEMRRRSKYDDSKLQPCLTLLFSDILMTTDMSYKFKRLVQLSKVSSSQLVERFNGIIFRMDSEKDLYLFCKDLTIAEEWLEKVLLARDRLRMQWNSRISLLTQRSNKNLQPSESNQSTERKNSVIQNRKARESLPIFPTSSSGFTTHGQNVPQLRNTFSKDSLQSVTETQEESTSSRADKNYDDYDI